MTASAATRLRARVDLDLTFQRGPDRVPPSTSPLDRFYARFPAGMLPEVAEIEATVRVGDRVLTIRIESDTLTNQEHLGLNSFTPISSARVVTRAEARRAYLRWKNRPTS